MLAISFGCFDGRFGCQINIVEAAFTTPSEDFLEQGQQPIVLKTFLKIDFVFLLLHSHFVQQIVMYADADFVEVSHHDEVLADVSAFQSSSKVVRHEPADDVATGRDDLADDVIFDFVISRWRNGVLPHDGENRFPVLPLIQFDLLDRDFLVWVFDRTGVADIRKRRGFLGRVSQPKEPHELGMLNLD